MFGHNSNVGLIALILGFICLAVWWIEDRFGTQTTGYVLLGLGLVIALVIGWVLSLATQKATLNAVSEFGRQDAATDRYRMASYKENARAETAERKAVAALTVLDAKRVDKLARQRAGMLMDNQRQAERQQAEEQIAQANEQWYNVAVDFTTDEDEA